MELRKLPQVDRVVGHAELAQARSAIGRRALGVIARDVIGAFRQRVQAGEPAPGLDDVVGEVLRRAQQRLNAGLARVVNATGVLLHTNLGRAPLPAASVARIAQVATGYSSLELDVELGVRTRRGAAAEAVLAELVGAEDALLVNNNAAAVLLSLSSIAAGREVVVSRGELVEIGGGFRIPEVLARSGARLVEVGTTNRTRIEDYAANISDRTAALLRVHPSNFKMSGFAERPALAALAALARERGIPLIKDLGGGLIVEPSHAGANGDLSDEPSVQQCLRAGVDLVCFSLDKLFGGPQGGVVAGAGTLVARLREDPLARALRVDKLMLGALEPVLEAYARGDLEAIPVHAMLSAPLEKLRARVEAWQAGLGGLGASTSVESTDAAIGGGTLAEAPVPSVALVVRCSDADAFSKSLRAHAPPIIARIERGAVMLDARSVLPDEDEIVVAGLRHAFGRDGAR
jgi:L-seryl-tRNA(Ser) seleniumtransferase